MRIMKQQLMYLLLAAGFILGSHKGYISLWQDGRIEPIAVYPYRVTSLPAADQQVLQNGIHIEDPLELANLLEDYLS